MVEIIDLAEKLSVMEVGIKSGVKLSGLQPQTVLAIMYAIVVCDRHATDFTITSVNDGRHGRGSLHGKGYAFDMRTRDMDDGVAEGVYVELKKCLSEEFDVVLENDHIHIEWDPD